MSWVASPGDAGTGKFGVARAAGGAVARRAVAAVPGTALGEAEALPLAVALPLAFVEAEAEPEAEGERRDDRGGEPDSARKPPSRPLECAPVSLLRGAPAPGRRRPCAARRSGSPRPAGCARSSPVAAGCGRWHASRPPSRRSLHPGRQSHTPAEHAAVVSPYLLTHRDVPPWNGTHCPAGRTSTPLGAHGLPGASGELRGGLRLRPRLRCGLRLGSRLRRLRRSAPTRRPPLAVLRRTAGRHGHGKRDRHNTDDTAPARAEGYFDSGQHESTLQQRLRVRWRPGYAATTERTASVRMKRREQGRAGSVPDVQGPRPCMARRLTRRQTGPARRLSAGLFSSSRTRSSTVARTSPSAPAARSL